MERVLLERRVIRSRFTVCSKKLQKFIETGEKSGMSSELLKLSNIYEELTAVQNKLLNVWLDQDDRDEHFFENDLETSDSYDSQFYSMQQKVKEFSTSTDADLSVDKTVCRAAGSVSSGHKRRLLRLPKLELPKFDGNVKSWLQFWTQFKKIDSDSDIEDDDKFQFLLQSVEPGCNARELVESFPPSAENYTKVIQQLKQRYARDELIIEHYVRELLKLTIAQGRSENKMSLRTLYDKLMTQILSLESLGVTRDKYAAFLFPMVESALPEDILRAWNRSEMSRNTADDKNKSQLTYLLEFVRSEVESEEKINMSRSGFSKSDAGPSSPSASFLTTSTNDNRADNKKSPLPTTNNECIWCDRPTHNSSECKTPIKWSLGNRKEFLKKKNACLVCLRCGHYAKKCRKFPKCVVCQKRHYPIMCDKLSKEAEKIEEQTVMNLIDKPSTVLLQTVKLNLIEGINSVTVRALLDSGAQRSFVKSDVLKRLKATPTAQEHLSHNLFGGIVKRMQVHNSYVLNCRSLDGTFNFKLYALEQKVICEDLPKVRPGELLAQLKRKGIELFDCVNDSTEISLLIGSDVLGSLYTGRSERVSDNLVAIQTKFGWVMQGPAYGMYCTFYNYNTTQKCTFDIDDLWKLETIGIKDEAETKTKKRREKEVEQFFKETVKVNSANRYEVRLPWKDNAFTLSPNYETALKRLRSTTGRLKKLGLLAEYDDVFNDWLNSGIIKVVNNDNPYSGHYLPHHVVVKDSSLTTRIRPVFDASADTKEGFSLNKCLEKGSNLIKLLPRLLIQFRKQTIGITADIKKAFLQISVCPEDRQYLKFLWWQDIKDKDKGLKIFRHCRVVFGVTTSSYLLAATILYHLEKFHGETADRLRKSFYVDNCVLSVNNEYEMVKFIKEAKDIMMEKNFELRCWVTGPIITADASEPVSVLGLTWDPKRDELYCKVPFVKHIDVKLTKRNLLAMAQSIFDPIGYVCPTTLIPKILIQKCWDKAIDWDEDLPINIAKQAKEWLEEVGTIEKCRIPRRMCNANLDECDDYSLHIFSDASQSAYSGCVFLRCENNGIVTVQLVIAKSRVSPIKVVTMPRLELIAALMATRLATEAKTALGIKCHEYYWSDSSIVIAWIKRQTGLNVFVHNRVKEILSRTNVENWRHIPGEVNPADLPSRGCTGRRLLESRWWEGPAWLTNPETTWPQKEVIVDEEEVNKEVKRSCLTVQMRNNFSDRLLYFSKYSKIVRTIAWCVRFARKCQKTCQNLDEITAEEFENAEIRLLRIIQKEGLNEIEELSKRLRIEVVNDCNGLMRVKTRLTLGNDDKSFTLPVILPGKSTVKIVYRLVQQKHVIDLHSGSQVLINSLREQYWIIGVRRLVKKVIRECIICKRFKAKACTVPSAPLPIDRITTGVPFEVTGVDLAGPLLLKDTNKSWIVVFTCGIYRAIHLEICSMLSTEEFLLTLRRFIARSLLVQKKSLSNYELQVGDVVLVGSDDTKRVTWPLAIVTEVIAGSDGVGRMARVRTVQGERLRAFQRLYPLELSQTQLPQTLVSKAVKTPDQATVPNLSPPKTTRSGRLVKIPSKFL